MIKTVFFLCLFSVSFAFASIPLEVFEDDNQGLKISINNQQSEHLFYNFGSTRVRTAKYVTFTLENSGSAPLEIKSVNYSGMAYFVRTNCPFILKAGESCATQARFYPSHQGHHYGDILFEINDAITLIDLSGYAYN